jgi:hypothetical protein
MGKTDPRPSPPPSPQQQRHRQQRQHHQQREQRHHRRSRRWRAGPSRPCPQEPVMSIPCQSSSCPSFARTSGGGWRREIRWVLCVLSSRELHTLAKSEAQIGSTSATLAALMRVEILSAYSQSCCQHDIPPMRPVRVGVIARSRAYVEFRWLSYGDLEAIVGEDKRRVRRCQLSGRHLELCDVWTSCSYGQMKL